MKSYLILVFSVLVSTMPAGGDIPDSPSILAGSYLGFNLMPGPNNSVVNFAIVTPLPDGRQDAQFISRLDFIRLAGNKIRSDVNPDGIDFFSKFQIEDCGAYRDSLFRKTSFSCSVIDGLWKLRYKLSPYASGGDSLGWTGGLVPSMGQMNVLQTYGITRLDDYCYGEKAFKLLHDMQSYAWISRYKSS